MEINNDELTPYLLDFAGQLENQAETQADPLARLALTVAANSLRAYTKLTLVEQVSLNLIGAGVMKPEIQQIIEDVQLGLGPKELAQRTSLNVN